MEFKQLQSFVSVVKTGSFTKAAEALYLSQPTISAHIRALEEELGSCLIIRTTKSIEVTPRGWAVYESAASILEQREQLLRRWEDGQKLVRLGASTIPAAYILPELLPDYEDREVRFHLQQSDSQEVLDALLNGHIDVGLVGMEARSEHLACFPFYTDRLVLITPAAPRFRALLAQPAPPVAELLREPIFLREAGSGSLRSASRLLAGLGVSEEELRPAGRVRDQEAIKSLVSSGMGVSIISRLAVRREAAEGRLLVFDLPQPASCRSLYVAYHGKFVLPGYIRSFIDYVRAWHGGA